MSTKHEARLVLAKAFERQDDRNDKDFFELPDLPNEDSGEEKLGLKKRRQLLEQKVLREKLMIQNLELYNDGVKVSIEDQVNEN